MAKFVFPQPIDYSEVGGPDGPPGPVGPVGPTGPAGGSSGTFIHEPGTAPAVERDTQDRLRDTVHLFDFIPVSEHAAIEAGSSAYDCLGDIHNALRQFRSDDADLAGPAGGVGPRLQLPRGKLCISGPIEIRGMCEIAGSGGAYSTEQSFPTIIEVAQNQHGIIVHNHDTYAQHKTASFWKTAGIRTIWVPSGTANPRWAYAGWETCSNHGNHYRCITSGVQEAVKTAWAANTVYALGAVRGNGAAGASNVYECVGAGTSAASGGPAGTGSGIADGTATWDFLHSYGPSGTGASIAEAEGSHGFDPPVWAYQASAYVPGQVIVNYATAPPDTAGIYECVVAPASGNSINKPTHATGDVAYADGYTWRFLEEARGGNGSILRSFCLKSLGGTRGHGIWLRGRANIYDVHVRSFPHNGINIVGTTNGPFEKGGNTNNVKIQGGRITANGRTGTGWDYGTGIITPGSNIYFEGSDSNAGSCFMVDCSNAGQWGFWDNSFLGNNFIACHTAVNGVRGRRYYDGNAYMCADAELGLTVAPSQDRPDAWKWIAPSPGPSGPAHPPGGPPTVGAPGPEWVPDDPYLTSGGSYNGGFVVACYAESGDIARQHAAGNWSLFGGFSPNETMEGGFGQPIYVAANYLTTRRFRVEQKDMKGVRYSQSFFGTGDSGSHTVSTFQHPVHQVLGLNQTLDPVTGSITLAPSSGSLVSNMTLGATHQNFGRSVAQPYSTYINKLFLGSATLNPTATELWLPSTDYEEDDLVLNSLGTTYLCVTAGTSDVTEPTSLSTGAITDGTVVWNMKGPSAARQVTSATAMPATGAWAAGDFVFNSAPLLGEPIGWRCILSGTPGTWQPLRDLGSQQTLATDAVFTLTPGTSPYQTLHTGTLTANRTVTLSTSGAIIGLAYKITRTGAGAFNLNVGTGPLKALATNTWGEFTYDGTAYYLSAYGAL